MPLGASGTVTGSQSWTRTISRVSVGMLVLAGAVSGAGCGAKPHPSARKAKKIVGVVDVHNSTWRCHGPVDLDLLRVRITNSKRDAVHLNRGCTGVIRRIEVVGDGRQNGPTGDGVKVHAGAHDLKILGGIVDCGRAAKGAHQDAIQVMGGKRVTFARISSRGCANSFMFINWGRQRKQKPQDVVCDDCQAESHNFSVRVGNSIRSGAVGGSFVSRVPPRATAEAKDAVLNDTAWHRRPAVSP